MNKVNRAFWQGKKVLITGNTGFKGSWLSLWLHLLGANITGYALHPPTNPSLFKLCKIDELVDWVDGNVNDAGSLNNIMQEVQPEIVIHMAAQPLVVESYINPVQTYQTNVMGTVHLLEAVRHCNSIAAVINVTTDKCYDNKEWVWGYREIDALGGRDPYSSSKACSELVTTAYCSAFFKGCKVGIASARAGNVIGGGDWAVNRLIPDCFRAILNSEMIKVRNPHSIRPWQHVLEPLSGYLVLAQKLCENPPGYSGGWNFGPDDNDAKRVEWIVNTLCKQWGESACYYVEKEANCLEAQYLKLDCSKAKDILQWSPQWDVSTALDKTIEWVKVYQQGGDLRETCFKQIQEYCSDKKRFEL